MFNISHVVWSFLRSASAVSQCLVPNQLTLMEQELHDPAINNACECVLSLKQSIAKNEPIVNFTIVSELSK